MSERDRAMAIATLAEAFNVRDLTPARIRIYSNALEKVPVPVLEPMVTRAVQTRQFFPRVAELIEDAEAVRLELLKSLKHDPCAQCDETGWVTREIDGVKRLSRCFCWQRFQEKRAALGVGEQPLAMPAGNDGEAA